jgi:5-methylcytosine-specific restriction protein A
MSRKKFIESNGATCKNWNWSWSFVNHKKKFVIFGYWDWNEDPDHIIILKESWAYHNNKRNKGYSEAIKYIDLIYNNGYSLKIFPMIEKKGLPEGSAASIDYIIKELYDRSIEKVGNEWQAVNSKSIFNSPEEIESSNSFPEGAQHKVTVNLYERNAEAREICIAHYKAICSVCSFDFEGTYGDLGKGFIHVHHLIPIGKIKKTYQVDPINDLIPVCPNCHSMIHKKTGEPYTIKEMKEIMRKQKSLNVRHK